MVRVEAVSLLRKPLQCVIRVRDKDGFTPSNLLLYSVSHQQRLLFFLFFNLVFCFSSISCFSLFSLSILAFARISRQPECPFW